MSSFLVCSITGTPNYQQKTFGLQSGTPVPGSTLPRTRRSVCDGVAVIVRLIPVTEGTVQESRMFDRSQSATTGPEEGEHLALGSTELLTAS